MRFVRAAVTCLSAALFLSAQPAKGNNLLMQVSTIDALLSGLYNGEVHVSQLLGSADFGIGTFDSLNGEMIVLKGRCYQVTSDGKVTVANETIKTPFAAVTRFKADTTFDIPGMITLAELQKKIDSTIVSVNYFYALHVRAHIVSAKARSVPAQKPPYRPLTEIVKTQPTFAFGKSNVDLVGYRCPPYVKGLNVPGYHLHILSDDRKSGGHLLELTADSCVVEIDKIDKFEMMLPHDSGFAARDFSVNKDDALNKVER